MDAVVNSAFLSDVLCPGSVPQGAGGPFPLCTGAAQGETRAGMLIAYLSSEGIVADRAGLKSALESWVKATTPQSRDAYGDGANRLYSVGCPAGIVPCRAQYALVFSQIRAGPRVQMVLYFQLPQTGPANLVFVAIGPLLDPAQQEAAIRGGAPSGFLTAPGWPPLTTFYPITP
jgi:hypothetical protein